MFAEKGVTTLAEADARLGAADLVLFAVKPQMIEQVAHGLRDVLSDNQLCVSVVAGIPSHVFAHMLGGERPVVRCMPNVPALHRAGVTGMWANQRVNGTQRELAQQTLAAVGQSEWFQDEAMIDAVTAVAGSGPAYFFYLMEIMQHQAEQLGFQPETARRLVAETAYGASLMVRGSEQRFSDLRCMVTSPNGTTEAAIRAFDAAGVRQAVAEGIQCAWTRSKELGEACSG